MTTLKQALPLALATLAMAVLVAVALPIALSFALVAFGVVAAVTWMAAVHALLGRRGQGVPVPVRARSRRS